MAKNMIFKYTENKTRVRVLDAATDSGVALLDPDDGRPAITITTTGAGISRTLDNTDIPLGGGVTAITYLDTPASLEGLEATLAYDGTWELAAFSTGTTPAPTTTVNGDTVYITGAGVITLDSTAATVYGYVDYPTDYTKRAGILPVRIGA